MHICTQKRQCKNRMMASSKQASIALTPILKYVEYIHTICTVYPDPVIIDSVSIE